MWIQGLKSTKEDAGKLGQSGVQKFKTFPQEIDPETNELLKNENASWFKALTEINHCS